ncbi:UNVERIFIED_CONTAM: hypothetical protein FKN15_000147, partial [Acipenser sinensis]
FARHIKKSEGQKTPKVELQISIYGVKILDPKTKEVQHNCQLHRISFCADDKTDKRIFTFICKDAESNKHLCFVFDSEKCIQELETENTELKKQVQVMQEQLMLTKVCPAGSVTVKSPPTDVFDMVPFSPASPVSPVPASNGMQPPALPRRSNETEKDLFGAEPFDPFICGEADFPPDIQSKLDEMQVTTCLSVI